MEEVEEKDGQDEAGRDSQEQMLAEERAMLPPLMLMIDTRVAETLPMAPLRSNP